MKREWTHSPRMRKGRMVSEAGLAVIMRGYDPGYMSVYMFSDEDAEVIEERGHSRDFTDFEVYSDCVFIDIDGTMADLDACTHELRNQGYRYDVWFSGGKGYHVVVPMTEMLQGKNVPYSQLKWVESLGCKFDPSIYRPSSLISLPGRVHPSTGIKKHKLKVLCWTEGKTLDLELVEMPVIITESLAADPNSMKRALAQLNTLAQVEPTAGDRHNSIWKTACSCCEAGFEFDTTLDLLININDSWVNPKEHSEVERAVRGAY